MVGIYFSGTGNSRYALELFLQEYNKEVEPQRDADFIGGAFSIEDGNAVDAVRVHDTIAFSYPVQYSTVPKILRDFVIDNQELWKNKKIFIIATMGLFSGDGAGNWGRLLQKYGGETAQRGAWHTLAYGGTLWAKALVWASNQALFK